MAAWAFLDLAPEGGRSDEVLGVITAGLQAARAAGDSPLDWESFARLSDYPELRPLLAAWARENVLRMRGEWQTTYLVLGDDPGGSALARTNVAAPIAGRLVTAIREALSGPRAQLARDWLQAMASGPLRDVVPLEIKLDLTVAAAGRWVSLETLRRAYEGLQSSTEAAPAEERPFLVRELEALARRRPDFSKARNAPTCSAPRAPPPPRTNARVRRI